MNDMLSSSSERTGFSSNIGKLLKATGIILWAFFLMAGYFWAHKPFTGAIISGLVLTVLNIVIWLGVSWLGTALGYRTAQRYLVGESAVVRLALGAGTGMGLLSLLMLALGIVGVFRSWAAWALLFILLVLLHRQVPDIWRDVRNLRLPRAENGLQRWFLIYAAANLLLTFLMALAPPTAWDSLTYHLTGPQLYIEAGRIVHPVDIPHLGFPLLGQMHFALGMLLLGDGPAALFHFGYGLMALVVTVALARRAFGKEAAWFASALLLSIPTLFTLMSWPYVDITLLFYATAAFYGFVRWRQSYLDGAEEKGWLWLMALSFGFAGGVKYTAVLIPVATALSMAWVLRRDGVRAIISRVLPMALISALLVLPYLVENWLTVGNPVYPFLLENSRFWDEWRTWWYDRPGTGLATTAPWRLPLVPLELTILGTEGTELYEATIGPLLLLGTGLLVVVWRNLDRAERALSGHMLFFFGVNYFFWLSGVARTQLLLRGRFLFFIFGVVAVLGGLALARLSRVRIPQLDVNWMVRVVVVLSMGLILFSQITEFLRTNPLPVIVGLESRSSFTRRRLGDYVDAMAGVNQLPAGSKVDFLWESRSYTCAVECWPDPILDRYLHYTQHYEFDAGELAAYWRNEGYTHVLLHEAGLDFVVERQSDPIRAEDLAILEALREQHLEAVEVWPGTYTLYKIISPEEQTEAP